MLDVGILSELEIVARGGAEQASHAISSFTGREITITVSAVDTVPIEEIPERLGDGSQPAVGLLSRICGDVTGNAALIFDDAGAAQLIRWLGGRVGCTVEPVLDDMQRSMLEETANITISSFMNNVAAHLSLRCVPNAPVCLSDMAGAILSVLLLESAEVADKALMFSTAFRSDDHNMEAFLVFLPSPNSFDRLQEGLQSE